MITNNYKQLQNAKKLIHILIDFFLAAFLPVLLQVKLGELFCLPFHFFCYFLFLYFHIALLFVFSCSIYSYLILLTASSAACFMQAESVSLFCCFVLIASIVATAIPSPSDTSIFANASSGDVI